MRPPIRDWRTHYAATLEHLAAHTPDTEPVTLTILPEDVPALIAALRGETRTSCPICHGNPETRCPSCDGPDGVRR